MSTPSDPSGEEPDPYGQPYGQPSRGQGQPAGYWPPGYGPPGYGYAPPPERHPSAMTALVLGIVGLVVCQVASPFAWWYGKRTMTEIEAQPGRYGGYGEAKAGWICGIIGTVLLGLALLVFVLLFVAGIVAVFTLPDIAST